MEFIVTLLVAAVLVRCIKIYVGVPKKKSPLVLSGDIEESFASGSRNAASRWLSAGQSFVCRGYAVEDGMVYVGERMRDFTGMNEGCLINPSLPVAPLGTPYERVKDALPRYEKLTPEQRGGYLHWLGRGRSGQVDPAWLFLFLFGIERRLFVDGPRGNVSSKERNELAAEIRRLAVLYGEHRSFRGYCKNLLAVEWALKADYAEIPEWVDFTDRFCAGTFNVIFALYVSRNQPIPAEVAFQWAALHPEFVPGTAARRAPDDFRRLFLDAYTRNFDEGIVIHKNRSPLNLIYKGANPSLGNGVKLSIPSLPDPFLLATPLKKIRALAAECVSEMEREGIVTEKSTFPGAENEDSLDSLDDTHREFLARLAERPLWARGQVLAFCESLAIVPDPSIELLNSWACVTGGIPLIEDGDPVFVDISLLQEILVRESSDAG